MKKQKDRKLLFQTIKNISSNNNLLKSQLVRIQVRMLNTGKNKKALGIKIIYIYIYNTG